MKRVIAACIACAALAGCVSTFSVDYEDPLPPEVTRSWTVNDVVVIVPERLTVAEAPSRIIPDADIVWHGDPPGDRRAQVAAILDRGATVGVAELNGTKPVILELTLQQFHGVTPAAVSRAPAAVHNIAFSARFTTTDGQALTYPTNLRADVDAIVGVAAVLASQQGNTQKYRVTNNIAKVVAGWVGSIDDPRQRFVAVGR
ncbi:MAG: DUF6778 family protein [Pseudomonadota bacterium]